MSVQIKLDTKALRASQEITIKAFNNVIRNRQALGEMGDVVIRDIQIQTRQGKSVLTGARLKALSDGWIKIRSKIVDTADTFSRRRSNLTVSGQLLASLTKFITIPGRVEISHEGIHRPYKTDQGKTIGKSLTNEKLSEYVSKDRPYIGISPRSAKQIQNLILAYARRSARVLKLIK